ncbi:hypothetical protein SDJN03_10252, partial [Cucurbita argyrosperma subsp. sororia]
MEAKTSAFPFIGSLLTLRLSLRAAFSDVRKYALFPNALRLTILLLCGLNPPPDSEYISSPRAGRLRVAVRPLIWMLCLVSDTGTPEELFSISAF